MAAQFTTFETRMMSAEEKTAYKEQLKAICADILQQRIAAAEDAIQSSRESANSEEKSSAGDKYETSRAMGHLSQEMHGKQLEDARMDLAAVNAINTSIAHTSIGNGSVVICKDFVFFISVGLGIATLNNKKIVLISAHAPLASAMHQKKAGDSFVFNGKPVEIVEVF